MTNHISCKRILSFTLFISIFFTSIHAQAKETKVLFPLDQSIIYNKEVRIVGYSASNSLTLTVSNSSGKKTVKAPVEKSAFGQVVSLAAGLNTIEISADKSLKITIFHTPKKTSNLPDKYTEYFIHSHNELTSACDKCHNLSSGTTPKYIHIDQKLSCITNQCHNNFEQKEFKHGPFADQQCLECHNPHGTINKYFLKNIRAALCFTCHSELEGIASEGKIVHFPVKKGECLSCHEHHESDLEFHLKRDTMLNLCLGCHNKTIIEHEYMHEPVESGDCNACHSPHTSDHKGLLYLGGKDLCLTCHEVRKEEFESKYVHEPVTKDCSLCHDPHGSNLQYHLKTAVDKDGKYLEYKKPLMETCLRCHRKLDPEVANQIEKGKVKHDPVEKGNCTVCHTPHSTNFQKQLNASVKEICFTCHPKIKKLITESKYLHGPVRTNDCAQCHLVHGSKHKNLLRLPFSLKYSGTFTAKDFALCFSCHNEKAVFEKESKSTGFRNGRNNLHYTHVTIRGKGRGCSTCHDIHASNQLKHLRNEIPFKKKFTIDLTYTQTANGGGCIVGCHKPRKYDREDPVKYKRSKKNKR